MFTDFYRVALTEARLVTAKLLWHFDMELVGDHSHWVDDARFYVSDLGPNIVVSADRTVRSCGSSSHSMLG